MLVDNSILDFQERLKVSITERTFIKVTLANYHGTETELKNIYVRNVVIKRQDTLAFTFRYKTRDIVKNFGITEGIELLSFYLNAGFHNATCFTSIQDIVLQYHNKKGYKLNVIRPSLQLNANTSHDKAKVRLIPAGARHYLQALRITDSKGEVFKNAQDKYKQINQYVALLEPMIKEFPDGILKVADMGSGKGYLTFALYDYLVNVLKRHVEVTGIEYRQDMVDLCNQISQESGFTGLSFVQGTIEDYDAQGIDLLIALHACDTATDDAIFKGLKAGASLIVVAPCCHKQIRREIEKGKAITDLDFIMRYGTFLERQSVMITDSMRSLLMEYCGYKTKVFDFIPETNTPKNVLIVGTRTKEGRSNNQAALRNFDDAKRYFGISYHHLERLLEQDNRLER